MASVAIDKYIPSIKQYIKQKDAIYTVDCKAANKAKDKLQSVFLKNPKDAWACWGQNSIRIFASSSFKISIIHNNVVTESINKQNSFLYSKYQ